MSALTVGKSRGSGVRADAKWVHDILKSRKDAEFEIVAIAKNVGEGIPYGQKSQTHRKGLVSGLVISSHSCFLKPQEHVQSGFDDQV
jgi:hypothetical protein